MSSSSIIAERTIGAFPLSIGTSLAFETLYKGRKEPYDEKREIPKYNDPTVYKQIWINVVTLIRNLMGAVNSKEKEELNVTAIADAVIAEMEMLDSIFANEGKKEIAVNFYCCYYNHLLSKSDPRVTFKINKTETQKRNTIKTMAVLQAIVKSQPDKITVFKDILKPKEHFDSYIFTHTPWDLLSYNDFKSLALLESHTGKIKTRKDWSTKYAKILNEDLSVLPFTRKLLLIFGDSYLINPMDIKLRRLIIEAAKKYNWNPLTSDEKVKMSLDLYLTERYLFEIYLKL